jgi:hypothetical protein
MPAHSLRIKYYPQEVEVGCLAACIQMALHHLGLRTSQTDLNRLLELTPAKVCRPSSSYTLVPFPTGR